MSDNILNCVAGSMAVSPPTPSRMRGRPRSRRGRGGRPTRQLGIPSDPAAAVIPSDVGIFQPPSQWQGNTCIAPAAPTFIGRRQHHLPAADMSPLDVFRLFLDDRFFDEVVAATNEYASQCLAGSGRPRSGMREWEDVDRQEMEKFFGLLFAMGLVQKPTLKDYWWTDVVVRSSLHREVMSRNRFEDILRYLHVVDNRSSPDSSATHDRLWKIRPFIDRLLSTFKTMFEPGKQLSLDEATCAFKGRVSFRTYNPNKPNKWGIKIFEVCDAATGYCLSFDIATGESRTVYNIVLDLMQNYLGKGHELYVDRYYTSIPLFRELYAKQTLAVGTCQINRRGMPKTFLMQNISRGAVVACRQGPILALRWRDKRDVIVLSTKHTPAMTTVSIRTRGGRVSKEKPMAVDDYNRHMGGVDKSDQMLDYYPFTRKTVKWWKKVYFHLPSLALVNAHKVYVLQNIEPSNQSMPLSTFLMAVVRDLVSGRCFSLSFFSQH